LKLNQYSKLSDYIHRKNVQKIEVWVLNIHFDSYYLLQKNREIIRILIDESFIYFEDWLKVASPEIFPISNYFLFDQYTLRLRSTFFSIFITNFFDFSDLRKFLIFFVHLTELVSLVWKFLIHLSLFSIIFKFALLQIPKTTVFNR
jgi:hypothetical protein